MEVFLQRILYHVNRRIPSHVNLFGRMVLSQEIIPGPGRWRKVQVGQVIGQPPVHFIGEWRVLIIGSQARLNVANGQVVVETDQTRRQTGNRIPNHQQHIRLPGIDNIVQVMEQAAEFFDRRPFPAAGLGQVKVRNNLKVRQRLA